jgi:hypothetical protein
MKSTRQGSRKGQGNRTKVECRYWDLEVKFNDKGVFLMRTLHCASLRRLTQYPWIGLFVNFFLVLSDSVAPGTDILRPIQTCHTPKASQPELLIVHCQRGAGQRKEARLSTKQRSACRGVLQHNARWPLRLSCMNILLEQRPLIPFRALDTTLHPPGESRSARYPSGLVERSRSARAEYPSILVQLRVS